MSGYVRIHRTLIGHPAFRNDAEAMAFAWMVTKAAWKPIRVRYKERAIQLQRGQLAVSQRDMARALDRDKAWIERLWKRLRGEAMITVAVEAGVAVITICNYVNYQASDDRREAVDEAPQEAGARQGQGTEQVSEEVKKEVTPQTPRKRGNGERFLIPSDWKAPLIADLPPKARACAEQWTQASYETEAEAFVCYWRSERKMKGDWDGTWANRIIARHSAIMRDQKFGNAAPEPKPEVKPSTAADLEERARRWEAIGRDDEAAECRRKAKALPVGQLIPFLEMAKVGARH